MNKKALRLILIGIFLTGLTLAVFAQHEVDLRANVPLYGQESCIWCGAACAQMIMNGYPDPAHRIFYPQIDIWNAIQLRNSTDPADAAWATDPLGLCETLKFLNPPPAGTWAIKAEPDRDSVMFQILFWMNSNNYPVATLINHGGHWVVIVHYVTDIEPIRESTPTLQSITKYDPEPHNVGSISTMTAAVWFATDWVGPVWYSGTWDGKYVAVIEPPVTKGTVKVKPMKRIGQKIISPEEAISSAKKWIKELKLSKKAEYAILQKKGIRNLPPMLVREEIKPDLEKEKNVPYYYIVPFGFEHEIAYCGVGLTRICVIVNAYTAEFEEIGAFGKPVRYLPEKEAINVVARALKLSKGEMREVKARLMFQPSDITHIRIYPFWQVMVKDRVFYIDQLGKLYRTIKKSVPGD
jgi:hypothetical protein